MSWVKIDDKLHGHPKAALAGLEAMGLWTLALSWSASYLTDGFIPTVTAMNLGGNSEIIERLISVGLWEQVEDGYQIHDYHDYNPSAEKVMATRAARAEAGRIGGQKSRPPDDGEEEETEVTEEAKRKQNGSKQGSKQGSKTEAKANPVPVPDPVPTTKPQEAAKPPAPPVPPSETIDADTPESRQLFARLQATAKAKGRRGPSRFETLEQKRDFLAAAQVLGDEFGDLLHKAMREGCTSRARAVAYLVGCAKNKGNGTKANRARSSPGVAGEPAGYDGIRQWLEQKGAAV